MTDLNETLADVWKHLAAGVAEPEHPFRTPVFCTESQDGPNARTLVLRGVDELEGSLICYSDTRARKWREVAQSPAVVWVFHDPRDQVQLRAFGVTEQLTQGELVDLYWAGESAEARNNYRTQAGPGQRLDGPGDGVPEEYRDQDSAYGREHFGVLVTRLTQLDWLSLASRRHWRARFTRDRREWQGHWIAP